MSKVVPTLSSSGWVSSAQEKADMLFAHFYESDKFQTYLYGDNVSNLQYVIERSGHDMIAVVSSLRATLETYLGRYYDTVNVDISTADTTPDLPSGKIILRVYCTVTDNGKDYSFGRLIEAMNSKLEKVVKINNSETVG